MITILYAIIESLILLRKGFNERSSKERIKIILQLIVAVLLGIGYCVWFGFIVVSEHLFDPSKIVSLIIAQEAIISGALASVMATINQSMKKADDIFIDEDQEDESNSDENV